MPAPRKWRLGCPPRSFYRRLDRSGLSDFDDCLHNTVRTGGFVCGAFSEGELKGFVSVENGFFGGENRYYDLSSLHVSEDMRRTGIGKTLFLAAAEWARKQGAKKLYISAHSAIESQTFYRSMGCVEASEYNQKHVEAEPYDCQMEYVLSSKK